ncbi:chorismate mutase [Candidatus Poriferisodalis sp.]|uniref:chorismate mutase n=1 Tax=Candidatus Poriferisodalis sp. TaxID=3101277 RepID=UPI003AF79630
MSDDQLEAYRRSIDDVDAALVRLLAERFRITQEIGVYKAAHGMPAADPFREEQHIGRLRALAAEAGLDPEFSEKFLRFVMDEVIRHHEHIAESNS